MTIAALLCGLLLPLNDCYTNKCLRELRPADFPLLRAD